MKTPISYLAIKRLAENPQGKRRPETGAEILTQKRSEKGASLQKSHGTHSVGSYPRTPHIEFY